MQRFERRKGVLSSSSVKTPSNSLDWDSPSNKTGTVKRRPVSGEQEEDSIVKNVWILPVKSEKRKQTKISRIPSIFYTKPVVNFKEGQTLFGTNDFLSPKTNIEPTKTSKFKYTSENRSYTSNTRVKRLDFRDPSTVNEGKVVTGEVSDKLCSKSENREQGRHQETYQCLQSFGYEYKQLGGKVSDSDSGIASPLSPSSLYGFLGYADKDSKESCAKDYKESFDLKHNCEDVSTDASGYTKPKVSFKQEQLQIYTDWANHYLEKARSKKRVCSLASDCSDGVLLAEVIESVTSQKIPDINRKPKSPNQMLENINLCLNVLRTQHVSGVESVSAQELRDGKLKAILALFFALSRHKQAVKQRQQQQQLLQQQTDMTPNS